MMLNKGYLETLSGFRVGTLVFIWMNIHVTKSNLSKLNCPF